MKRILYWAGMTICIAIGIGIYQLLQHYCGAFAEVSVGQLVLADDTDVSEKSVQSRNPQVAKEETEESDDDGVFRYNVGPEVPEETARGRVGATDGDSAQSTQKPLDALPFVSEREPDSDSAVQELQERSKPKAGFEVGGFGGDGRGGFSVSTPVPSSSAQEGVWSLGVGITWTKNKDVLHGFSHATGKWATLKIESPDQVVPIVGVNVAAVRVGNNVAAYSGATCTWDLLELSQPLKGQPVVYNQLVSARTVDHIYTFAAALGKWTSPTDTSLKVPLQLDLKPSGRAETAQQPDHHSGGHTIAQLEEAWEYAERKTIEVAQKLQRTDGSEDELAPLQKELREAVAGAFSARRMLQTARMDEMQTKLSQIKTALQSREQRRDRIIERRVEELQDPGLNWQSLSRTDQTSSTVRNRLKNAPRLPLGAPAGLRSHAIRRTTGGPGVLNPTEASGAEIPATGTPVGLPGPPNLPLESAANANTPTEPESSSSPAFPGSSPTSASNVPSFDWEKADKLQDEYVACHNRLREDRLKIDAIIETIDQLKIPWADASAEERAVVEQTLRSSTSLGGMPVLQGHKFVVDGDKSEDGTPSAIPVPFVDDTERYETVRLTRLLIECQSLEISLNTFNKALNDLSRHSQQHQGIIAELELCEKDSELVHHAAEKIHRFRSMQHDMGISGDAVELIEAELAVERARINRDRVAMYLNQMQRIGKENSELPTHQYGEDLQRFRKLLKQVWEENPVLKSLPVPIGNGGGFF